MRARLRGLRMSIVTFTARNRALVIAFLSIVACAAGGVAITMNHFTTFHLVGVVTLFLILIAGTIRSRYEAAPLLTFMLPAMYRVLGLSERDRITIHHIKSAKNRLYE